MTRRQIALMVAGLSGVTAVNATGGAVYGLSGAPAVPSEWLRGSPFADYRVPSAVLGVVVAGTAAFATAAALAAHDDAAQASMVAGAVLTGWIIAQVAIIGLAQPASAGHGGRRRLARRPRQAAGVTGLRATSGRCKRRSGFRARRRSALRMHTHGARAAMGAFDHPSAGAFP